MSLKIFGFSQSRAFRTLWMAEEIKAVKDFDYAHEVDVFEDSQASDFLLEMNPMGQVPVIDDDGFILCESMAINLYLSKKHEVLAPNSLTEEAKATQWSFWVMTAVESLALDHLKYSIGMMGYEKNLDKANEVAQELQRPLGAIERALSSSPFLLGAEFTVADLNTSSVFMWLSNETVYNDYPKLKGWLERCFSRPAFLSARQA